MGSIGQSNAAALARTSAEKRRMRERTTADESGRCSVTISVSK